MTRVYLIRHGQTAWNLEEVFRGRKDIPLDDTGRQEAHLAGEVLQGEEMHAVYSSPLSRSMETAANIAKFHRLEVHPLDELIDVSYGDWEGMPKGEVEKRYPELYKRWLTAPHEVRFPNGESLEDVRKRTVAALERLVRIHPRETIALIGHRVVNKVISCAVLGLDNSNFWRIQQDTAGTNLFTYSDGVWIINYLNDTSYLRVLGKKPLADF